MPNRPILPSGRSPYASAGVAYQISARDLVVDQYGNVESVHPIDEGMAISMGVDRGSVKSSPDAGNDLRKIEYLSDPKLEANVRSAVLSAQPLARYVADGQVRIEAIEVDVSVSNRLVVNVSYVNLVNSEARDEYSHGIKLEWYSDG